MLEENVNTSKAVDKIKGTVTAELFDAKTGKLIEKQTVQNAITAHGREYLEYLQRVNFKDKIETLKPGADEDWAPLDPFQAIALVDYDQLEDPNGELRIQGKVIGAATKESYSGSSEIQGTPNSGLSETTETHTKWVFDWPTHAGNGTFSSVSWCVSVPSWSSSNLHHPTPVVGTTRMLDCKIIQLNFNNSSLLAYGNESMLFMSLGTTVTVYDNDLNQITSFSSISASGIAWDNANEKLWVISSSSNQIASYSQDGDIIDAPINITNRSYLGLTFDGTDLWTLVNWQVYKISTSGIDLFDFDGYFGQIGSNASNTNSQSSLDIAYNPHTQTIHVLGRGRSNSQQSDSNYHLIYGSFDTTGQSLNYATSLQPQYKSDRTFYTNFGHNETGGRFDIIDKDKIIVKAQTNGGEYPSDTWTIQWLQLDGMGSRALLPSPITKTDQQTLRITYQMDYDYS